MEINGRNHTNWTAVDSAIAIPILGWGMFFVGRKTSLRM
jgi:hypothetical protein